MTTKPQIRGLAITLALTGIPASLSVVCLGPVLPLIEGAYSKQPEVLPLIKYISVSIGMGMVMGAPLAGAVSDRAGRRATLIIATIAFCVFGALGYLVDHVPTLILLRTLTGIAAAAILTMGVALMGENFQGGHRDRLIGINAMCSSLAAIATVSLSGLLGSYSLKLPFLLHLLAAPIVLLTIAFVPRTGLVQNKADAASQGLSLIHWSALALALGSGIAIFSIPVYLPFFIRDAGLVDPVINAAILAFMSVCSALFAGFYGKARTYLSIGAAFCVSLILFAAGCCILLLPSNIATYVVAAILLGCGMAWVAPNLMSAASSLSVAGNRGRIVGLVKGANLSGSFMAVLLLDPIYRWAGPYPTIMAIALLATVVAAIGFNLLKPLALARN